MAKANISETPAVSPASPEKKTRKRKERIEPGFSAHMTVLNGLVKLGDEGVEEAEILKPYIRNMKNRMKRWQRISYSE